MSSPDSPDQHCPRSSIIIHFYVAHHTLQKSLHIPRFITTNTVPIWYLINESHKKLAPPKDKSLGHWEARDHWCCSGKALGKFRLRSDLIFECFWHDFGLEFDLVLNWIKPPFTYTCRIQFEYELSWYSVPIKSELTLRLFWFGIWVWFQFELNLSTLSSYNLIEFDYKLIELTSTYFESEWDDKLTGLYYLKGLRNRI